MSACNRLALVFANDELCLILILKVMFEFLCTQPCHI